MALQTFSVLRAQDPANPKALVSEITPKNWRRYPAGVVKPVDANVNEAKPRYSSMTDWGGGAKGDDITISTATVALASDSGGAAAADYHPKTQAEKASALGTSILPDLGRPRGVYAPSTGYLTGGSTLVAPTVVSVVPNTAVAGSNPIVVTVTCTNIFVTSQVITGGTGSPWDAAAKFIAPNKFQLVIDPRSAIAGSITVAVMDHSVLSNTDKLFTFT